MDVKQMFEMIMAQSKIDRENEWESMTLGDLKLALMGMDANLYVNIDAGSAHSYRGYYEYIAFEKGNSTVAELLDSVNECIGKTFCGYKGGDFKMTSRTFVFIAEYGNTGELLVGFDDNQNVITKEDI